VCALSGAKTPPSAGPKLFYPPIDLCKQFRRFLSTIFLPQQIEWPIRRLLLLIAGLLLFFVVLFNFGGFLAIFFVELKKLCGILWTFNWGYKNSGH
jgi:hypothetical protein